MIEAVQPERAAAIREACGLGDGDAVFFACDKAPAAARLAGQVRSYTDDLHRVVSGEQPQTDLVRQGVASVAVAIPTRAPGLRLALNAAAPVHRLPKTRYPAVAVMLVEAAEQIADQLG